SACAIAQAQCIHSGKNLAEIRREPSTMDFRDVAVLQIAVSSCVFAEPIVIESAVAINLCIHTFSKIRFSPAVLAFHADIRTMCPLHTMVWPKSLSQSV